MGLFFERRKQGLYNPADLLVTPDDRLQISLCRVPGEVSAEAGERGEERLGGMGQGALLCVRGAETGPADTVRAQQLAAHRVVRGANDQDVRGRDHAAGKRFRYFGGLLENRLHTGSHPGLRARRGFDRLQLSL